MTNDFLCVRMSKIIWVSLRSTQSFNFISKCGERSRMGASKEIGQARKPLFSYTFNCLDVFCPTNVRNKFHGAKSPVLVKNLVREVFGKQVKEIVLQPA